MVPTTSSWLSETSSMPSFAPSCSTRLIGGRAAASIGTAEPYAEPRAANRTAAPHPGTAVPSGSGQEDDLALGVALLQLADGVLDLVQRVGGGDREHDPAVGDP